MGAERVGISLPRTKRCHITGVVSHRTLKKGKGSRLVQLPLRPACPEVDNLCRLWTDRCIHILATRPRKLSRLTLQTTLKAFTPVPTRRNSRTTNSSPSLVTRRRGGSCRRPLATAAARVPKASFPLNRHDLTPRWCCLSLPPATTWLLPSGSTAAAATACGGGDGVAAGARGDAGAGACIDAVDASGNDALADCGSLLSTAEPPEADAAQRSRKPRTALCAEFPEELFRSPSVATTMERSREWTP